jgi:hypothetical protein
LLGGRDLARRVPTCADVHDERNPLPAVALGYNARYAQLSVPLTVLFPEVSVTLEHRDQGPLVGIIRSATMAEHELWRESWCSLYNEHDYERGFAWKQEIMAGLQEDGRLCLVVSLEESLEGMLSVSATPANVSREAGERLVYVEYVATAPWNDKRRLHDKPKKILKPSLGGLLVRLSVRLSRQLGFRGRIALHAVQEVVPWYRALGLSETGRRETEDGIWTYFEGFQTWASGFLKEAS